MTSQSSNRSLAAGPPDSADAVEEKKDIGPIRRVQYVVEWMMLILSRRLLGLLPWRLAVALGAAMGDVAYRLGIHRRIVVGNLQRAFPEWSATEARRVARRVFRNAYRGLIETLLLHHLSPQRMDQLVEGVEGFQFAEPLLTARRPIIVLTGHLGNWELLGAYFARQGYHLKVFAKPLHNPLVEGALLAARRSVGLDIIYTGGGLKAPLRYLRNGGILGFLADQDARRGGIPVPFFGIPASTVLGPAMFAHLARAPILPVFSIRVAPTRHRFLICPPIEPPVGETREVVLEQLTRAHVEALEQVIRRYPDQYFWFHDRWKTRIKKLKRTSLET